MKMEHFYPFKDNLVNHDNFHEDYARPDVIKDFENNPDKIVRFEKFSPKQVKNNDFGNLEKRMENHKKGERLFFELREKYGINFPDFSYVVGEGSNAHPMIYTIVDRVKGEHLTDAFSKFRDEKGIEMIENHFVKIISYLKDKYVEKEDWLCDIVSNKQYMFGGTDHDQEKDLYLIDVQPLFLNFDDNGLKYFHKLLTQKINNEIIEAENGLKTDLPICRKHLSSFLKEMSFSVPNNKAIKDYVEKSNL